MFEKSDLFRLKKIHELAVEMSYHLQNLETPKTSLASMTHKKELTKRMRYFRSDVIAYQKFFNLVDKNKKEYEQAKREAEQNEKR